MAGEIINAYRNSILAQMGFKEGPLLSEYLRQLSFQSLHFESLRNALYPGKTTEDLSLDRSFPYNITDFIIDEFNFKNKRLYNRIYNNSSTLTPSLLGTFAFCPTAFVIQKSFVIPKNTLASRGILLHERQLLLTKYTQALKGVSEGFDAPSNIISSLKNSGNESFFNDIKNSELVYGGHDQQREKSVPIYNRHFDVSSSPDYIFRRTDRSIFVVEEKFHYKQDEGINTYPHFFSNHKAQVAAYLKFIPKNIITNGYLVYWTYNFTEDGPNIYRCDVYNIKLNKAGDNFITRIYYSASELIQGRAIPFDTDKISPTKCTRCLCSAWCGHKTKQFNQLTLPYADKFLYKWRNDETEKWKKELERLKEIELAKQILEDYESDQYRRESAEQEELFELENLISNEVIAIQNSLIKGEKLACQNNKSRLSVLKFYYEVA